MADENKSKDVLVHADHVKVYFKGKDKKSGTVRLRRLPGVEVQYHHLRVILLCRIWMQEDTQRLIFSQVRPLV